MGIGEAQDFSITTGNSYGIYASAYDGFNAYGIYAYGQSAVNNWAGYFSGNVRVIGTLDDSKHSLRIDHPLDPENQILEHVSVNSPEMLNVYSGNVTTDQNGQVRVNLPDYFEAFNADYRYQLTVIGSFAQAIIKEEVHDNQFVIATSEPYTKVSWQVSGVRQDDFAKQNPVMVESDKKTDEQGYFINPEAFGFDQNQSIEYINNKIFRDEYDQRKGR